LAPEHDLKDVIEAAFPAGSMTGAPKIRAMQIISQLEGVPRGIYSGAAGHIGIDGSADLGMVIRSLIFDGPLVSIGVGGGITVDSDPASELEETKLKAAALLAVLGSPDPWS
jgi:anthranilate/para-aminobenzoate synthase component I